MVEARRALGVVAVACLLAVTGCTGDAPAAPSPTPTPAAPTPTPTETSQERQQRLDYAAAEKSYRTFRTEYNRVLRAGGAKVPTRVMKETAEGEYLSTFAKVVRGYRLLGSKDVGVEKVVEVHDDGYTPTEILLRVCEDSRDVRTLRKSGENSQGELRTASLKIIKSDGRWKVRSGTGREVESCT